MQYFLRITISSSYQPFIFLACAIINKASIYTLNYNRYFHSWQRDNSEDTFVKRYAEQDCEYEDYYVIYLSARFKHVIFCSGSYSSLYTLINCNKKKFVKRNITCKPCKFFYFFCISFKMFFFRLYSWKKIKKPKFTLTDENRIQTH